MVCQHQQGRFLKFKEWKPAYPSDTVKGSSSTPRPSGFSAFIFLKTRLVPCGDRRGKACSSG